MDETPIPRRSFLQALGAAAAATFSAPRKNWAGNPAQFPAGKLFAIGGYVKDTGDAEESSEKDPYLTFGPKILATRLAKTCGGLEGKTVVLAITGSNPEDMDKTLCEYSADFERMGADKIIAIDKREQLDLPENIEAIKNAALTFFCGGDQDQHVANWVNTKGLAALQERFATDPTTVIGGNSAGTAAMSRLMITSEGKGKNYKEYYDRAGFNFTILTLDTHSDRERDGYKLRNDRRIKESNRPAIALPEGTAALIEGPNIELIGAKNKKAFVLPEPDTLVTSYPIGSKFTFDGQKITPVMLGRRP